MKEGNPRSEPVMRTRDIGPRVPIDGHPLTPVPDPRAEYYRCHGLLKMYCTDGVYRGSGTLIAAGDGVGILTCAHNLYDGTVAGPAERIEFFPARHEAEQPYGMITAESAMLRIPAGYLATPQPGNRHDYAVVRLHRDQIPEAIGRLVTMQWLAGELPATVQVTGYPDVSRVPMPDPVMYYSRGATLNDPTATGLLRYNASTRPGSSGSAVCRVHVGQGGTEVPDLAHVNAVHVDGNDVVDPDDRYNWGVYLTPEIIRWVTEQLAS